MCLRFVTDNSQKLNIRVICLSMSFVFRLSLYLEEVIYGYRYTGPVIKDLLTFWHDFIACYEEVTIILYNRVRPRT